jgi:hypothetical protein
MMDAEKRLPGVYEVEQLARNIAALPEARAYAEWLNAQAAAREAVIEAARELLRSTSQHGPIWCVHWRDGHNLRAAVNKLDGLNPPAALDQTQPNASTARVEAYQRGIAEAGNGFNE